MNWLDHHFEGVTLHTLEIDGQPAWLAREIGAITGYADRGQRVVKKIRSAWFDEFIKGSDYAYLDGVPEGLDPIAAVGTTPMVLFRPGLDLVLAKTCKPVGKRLRRFVVDRVLPEFGVVAASEASAPEPTSALGPRDSTDPRVLRECRLRDRLEFADRRFRALTLLRTNRTLRDLGRIDDETFAFTELAATQIALGVNVGGDELAAALGVR